MSDKIEYMSMSTMLDLLVEAKRQGINLFIENDKLRFSKSGASQPDEGLLENLRLYRNELTEYLKNKEAKRLHPSNADQIIRPREIHHKTPLSYGQQQLWFINQLGNDAAYHMTTVCKLTGPLNVVLLERAVWRLMERHEILRTIYKEDNGIAYQTLMESDGWRLHCTSIEAIGGEANLDTYIHDVIQAPFLIGESYPLRLHLVTCDAETHILIFVIHHIACDGTSISIFFDELAVLYKSLRTNQEPALKQLPIQYGDFAAWERGEENEQQLAEKINYWKNALQGVSPLRLSGQSSGVVADRALGKDDGFLVDAELVQQIKEVCLALNVTPFMFLLAAIKILLHKYSGQSDFCIGTPVANRSKEEITGLIGYFTNSIALRASINADLSFADYLVNVKSIVLNAFDRQDVPFEKVVSALGLKRDSEVNPVFQVMFNYNNQFQSKEGNVYWDELKLDALDHTNDSAQFDITFDATELSDGLLVNINYKAALFSVAQIASMKAHLQLLLKKLVADSDAVIGSISIITPDELQVLKSYNQPLSGERSFRSVVSLFEDQVIRQADKTVISTVDAKVSYRQLKDNMDAMAVQLKQMGVMPGDIVGVFMEPTAVMVGALLAILKTGAAYIPIDTNYPANRIKLILADAQISTVLTTSALQATVSKDSAVNCLLVEDFSSNAASLEVASEIDGDQTAYVLYTSGSTGKPKGVMVSHRSLSEKLQVESSILQLDDSVVTCLLTSYCFDVSLLEIFLPLILGGTLVIPPKESLLEPSLLTDVFLEERVTIIQGTPSFLYPLINGIDIQKAASLYIKTICSGGESLSSKLVEEVKYKLPNVRLNNHYGPTEATIDAVVLENVQLFDSNLIGRPMPGTQAFVVDDGGQLVPPGIKGELWIAGNQLASGYLNRLDLTTEKFGWYSFFEEEGLVRCYKTGDLARWTKDGLLEYFGRKDSQLKIRGYRIEPEEIQAEALLCEGVRQCVVTKFTDSQANKRLVAYIVLQEGASLISVQEWLKKQLPEYMVPAHFMAIPSIPLNANGKVAFENLPQPELQANKATYRAPMNAIESIMASIWGDLLGVDNVGVHDNFFELGGDSIITIQVVSRAKKAGIHLRPKDIFDKQTIAELCTAINDKVGEFTAEQGLLTGRVPLLPIQQAWFLEGEYPDMQHFNQDIILNLDKSLAVESVQLVVEAIIKAHDALRFNYTKENGSWSQYYGSPQPCFFVEDLSHVDADNLGSAISQTCDAYQKAIDLAEGGLSKWVLIKTPESESFNRIFIVVHHLAIDGVSWRIIIDDLQSGFQSILAGEVIDFGDKTNSYRQFAKALETYTSSGKVRASMPFWSAMRSSYKPLPVDNKVDAATVKDVVKYSASLSPTLTNSLLKASNRAYGTEINELLLAALVKTFCGWSTHNDLIVGLEGHGREEVVPWIDISRTVGWFTNLYPVALKTRPNDTTAQLIKSVKEQIRRIPDKGMSFGALRFGHSSLEVQNLLAEVKWDVVFNYLGQLDHLVADKESLLTIAGESRGSNQSMQAPFTNKFEVNAIVVNGCLNMQWSFNKNCYLDATVAQLAHAYLANLEQIINHCNSVERRIFTPSDFGLNGKVGIEDLDLFLEAVQQGKHGNSTLEEIYPLSPMQEGMLFHGLYNVTSTAYVEQLSFDLYGVDVAALYESWQFVAQSHSVLRTAFFHNVLAIPIQAVFKEVVIPFEIIDFTDFKAVDEQNRQVQLYLQKDIDRGFRFDEVPLMRITMLKKSADCYNMVWTSHHLLFDGWSIPVILKGLLAAYEVYSKQQKPLPQPIDNYKKYIDYLSHLDAQAEEYFWKNYLAPLESPTHLPFLGNTNERNKGGGIMKEADLVINEDITAKIKRFAQQHTLTINTVMQSAWAFLLHKYTGNEAVAFGVTVSGRPADKEFAQHGVGLYINTIPLLSELIHEQSVVDWMLKLQKGNTEGREFQYTALNKIQNWSGLKGDIFDSTLAFENFPVEKELEGEWALKIGNIQSFERNNYLLSLTVALGKVMGINFRYNGSLLNERYVAQIKQHFEHVLLQMVDQPMALLRDIRVIDATQAAHLIATFNDTEFDYGADRTLIEQWSSQVYQSPDKAALVFEGVSYTYQQVDHQSSILANNLVAEGIQKGSCVGVCLERSPDMIIAILAVLKCGGVYVPIDPSLPSSRISYMLKDARIQLVISKEVYDRDSMSFESLFEKREGVTVLNIEEYLQEKDDSMKKAPTIPLSPADPAYIMYTSGTTGTPKGIVVSHQNISKLVAEPGPIAIVQDDKVLQWSNAAFDGSTYDIYCTLLHGATLYLIQKEVARDAVRLSQFIEAEQISLCFLTTAMFNGLVDYKIEALKGLRKLLFGGQQVSIPHVKKAFEATGPGVIVHVYGPTETTVYASYYPVDNVVESSIPIGRPLANTSIYICDSAGYLEGIGCAGEIYIGGQGVAIGYLNNAELTAQHFLTNPYRMGEGERMYKTGDYGRLTPDGWIEFIGRKDDQVKVRGYRIELGEVESAIQKAPHVMQCAVKTVDDNFGNKKLIGYVVGDEQYSNQETLAFLQKVLSDYMIPAIIVELDRLPLTANGKVDKKALPDPSEHYQQTDNYRAPENDIQHQLVAIWERILSRPQIGVTDNFFSIGGDSIIAIRAISGIKKAFQLEISIADFYQRPTICELEELIHDGLLQSNDVHPVKNQVIEHLDNLKKTVFEQLGYGHGIEDVFPMSDIQKGMIFASQMNDGLGVYHDQMMYLLPYIDIDIYRQALCLLVEKHAMLRTTFNLDDYAESVQLVHREWPVTIDYRDIQDMAASEQQYFLRQYVEAERKIPFNIKEGPLWRVSVFKTSPQYMVYLFQFHHAILDGWSFASMNTEWNNLCQKLKEDPSYRPEKLTVTYRDGVVESMVEKHNEKSISFWQNEMDEYTRFDIFESEDVLENETVRYDADFFNRLKETAGKLNITPKTLCLGAYLFTLRMFTYQDDLTVGLVSNIRPLHEDGDKVLGCFLNSVPFRINFGKYKQVTWKDYLLELDNKLRLLKGPDRLTLLEIARHTGENSSEGNPFFDVIFNFIDFHVYNQLSSDSDDGATMVDDSVMPKEADLELVSHESTNTYLDISVSTTGGWLMIYYTLRKKLKGNMQLADICTYLNAFLEAIVANPFDTIRPNSLLPNHEQTRLLQIGMGKVLPYPSNANALQLFKEQAAQRPDAPAIGAGENWLTYAELDRASDLLAAYLVREYGSLTVVAVCIERSPALIITMLAIFKCGAAYLPIDKDYPPSRIECMLEDSKADLVVAMQKERSLLEGFGKIVYFDSIDYQHEVIPAGNANMIAPDSIAYIIFTSGSTGRPKGVAVTHKALANLIFWHLEAYAVDASSVATTMAGIGFDAFGWEVWPYLSCGAKLVVLTDEQRMQPDQWFSIFTAEKVTHSFVPTALVPEFLPTSAGKELLLKYLLTGGDALPPVDLSNQSFQLVNNYGPTENTVVASYYVMPRNADLYKPLIGRPINNVQLLLLNQSGDLVPPGVAGELYIGGKSLAKGYVGHEALTADRFVTNPFDESTGRLYRTGDLARWLPDGNLDYVGRVDQQIQLRGYRIELGEIEKALVDTGMIQQCVVMVKEAGSKKLIVAYYTQSDSNDTASLQELLTAKLPSYMIPSVFVLMERMPLTANGKIDRKALPEPDADAAKSNAYEAPRNEVEAQLVTIWENLLGKSPIGVNDNFFDLGGDSIITIQVCSRAKSMGYVLQPRDIFQNQTVAKLAKVASAGHTAIIGEQGCLSGPVALLPVQQWFLGQPFDGMHHFNQDMLLLLSKEVTAAQVEKAVHELLRQHDALRLVVKKEGDAWMQTYGVLRNDFWCVESVMGSSAAALSKSITNICNRYQQQLNFSEGKVFQAVLIETPATEHYNRLFMVAHHLSVDAVSWRIIVDGLKANLAAIVNGKALPQPTKGTSYREWGQALTQYATSPKVAAQIPYWKQVREWHVPLKVDKQRAVTAVSTHLQVVSVGLDVSYTASLLTGIHHAYGTEINDILLSALAYTIAQWNDSKAVVIGMEGHGREEGVVTGTDISSTVGWFTNVYPIGLLVDGKMSLSSLIKSVKEQLRSLPDKGMGFGALKYLHSDPAIRASLQGWEWDIVFNYLGQFEDGHDTVHPKSLDVAPESRGATLSADTPFNTRLELTASVTNKQLIVSWAFTELDYHAASIEALAQNFIQQLSAIIDHCTAQSERSYTPADYGLSGKIDMEELDAFLNTASAEDEEILRF